MWVGCAHESVCIHVFVYVCVCLCMHVCVCVCVCVCVLLRRNCLRLEHAGMCHALESNPDMAIKAWLTVIVWYSLQIHINPIEMIVWTT